MSTNTGQHEERFESLRGRIAALSDHRRHVMLRFMLGYLVGVQDLAAMEIAASEAEKAAEPFKPRTTWQEFLEGEAAGMEDAWNFYASPPRDSAIPFGPHHQPNVTDPWVHGYVTGWYVGREGRANLRGTVSLGDTNV